MTKSEMIDIIALEHNRDRYSDFTVLDEATPFSELFKDQAFDVVQPHLVMGIKDDKYIVFAGNFVWDGNDIVRDDGDGWSKDELVIAYTKFDFEDEAGKPAIGLDIVLSAD